MLVILLSSLFLQISQASETALVQRLAKDVQWRNLVHYKHGESQTDGREFFLAKNGKTDALAELQETLHQFRADASPVDNKSATCRFPARYLWLKKHFPEFGLNPMLACAGFKEFVTKSNAQSVSLAFSSYYINTPASAFGHTFLRLNSTPHREDNQDQAELLDYGISYAATMGSDPALLYALKGLIGMYPGVFTAVPYYYKVREYNDFEFRDLWEYKLSFTREQIDMMVAHIWELEHTYFDYLYFTENCAYHMLSLMEVANPALKLTDALPALYVVPIDTVRIVARTPGLVIGKHYRPSVLSRLELKSRKLHADEVKELRDLAERPQTVETALAHVKDPAKKAQMLETAVEAYDFLNARELVFRPAHTVPERHQLLSARAEVDVILPDEDYAPAGREWPDQGHLSQRWGMGGGYRDNAGVFGTASMRFALHDFLDPLPGQPSFSQIIMFDFNTTFEQTEYSQFDRFKLENFDFFHISSMQPITAWQRNVSWDGRIGTKTIRDGACDECFAVIADWGGGGTYSPEGTQHFISLLNKFHLDYSDDFSKPFRFAVGPELWLRLMLETKLSFLSVVGYKWSNYLEQPLFKEQIFTVTNELRYHVSKDWSFFLKEERQREGNHAGSMGFYNFF